MRIVLSALFATGLLASPALAGSDCGFNSAGMHENMTVAEAPQAGDQIAASSHDPKLLTEAQQPVAEETE